MAISIPNCKHNWIALLHSVFLGCVVLCAVGCDSRNPASISEERMGRPTPTVPPQIAQRREVRMPQQVAQPIVPEAPRPTIRPGKVIRSNPSPIEADLKPVALASLIRSGSVTVQGWNADYFRTVDGDTTSLYRTDQVNPLVITFAFEEAINLKTVRIFPSYSSYDWAVYTDASEQGLIIRGVPEEQWSRMDFEQPLQTKSIRIEVLRVERDNYVHLNEIEIYVQ